MTWRGRTDVIMPLSRHCKQFALGLTLTIGVFVVVLLNTDNNNNIDTTSSRYTLLRGRLKALGNYSINNQSKTPITWKTLGKLLPDDVTFMSYPKEHNTCFPSQIWKGINHDNKSHRYSSCGRVFYNRVPKCGSRTVLSVFKALSGPNNFSLYSYIRPAGRGYFRSIQKLINFGMNFSQLPDSFLYSQHLHFVNFTQLDIPPPVYINVIRDPVERAISHFYYNKYGSGNLMKKPSHSLSLEQCVSQLGTCHYLPLNVILPYFCGHPKPCRSGSPDALQRAKRTLRQSFLVVGLTENLPAFMDLLQVLMPNLFSNATYVFNQIEDQMINKTQTNKKPPVPFHTVSTLKDILADEYDFYNFAKQRFYEQYNKVFKTAVVGETDLRIIQPD